MPSWKSVLRRRDISSAAKLLWLKLSSELRSRPTLSVSTRRMSEWIGESEPSIRRAIKDLASRKLLTVTVGKGSKSATYSMPICAQESAQELCATNGAQIVRKNRRTTAPEVAHKTSSPPVSLPPRPPISISPSSPRELNIKSAAAASYTQDNQSVNMPSQDAAAAASDPIFDALNDVFSEVEKANTQPQTVYFRPPNPFEILAQETIDVFASWFGRGWDGSMQLAQLVEWCEKFTEPVVVRSMKTHLSRGKDGLGNWKYLRKIIDSGGGGDRPEDDKEAGRRRFDLIAKEEEARKKRDEQRRIDRLRQRGVQ